MQNRQSGLSPLNFKPRKTLVTGGAGFIGSHLAEGLLAGGHEVSVVDNFACGSEANLEGMKDNPSFKVHKADITDPDAMRPLFAGVDWV
ncbi:MAG TPA: NAD-dependent epimerase/dehydratase family protein, partial [Alphaproteobacteria bacterium]|nr:NAD-dependent epimerase/dehydratase family protein [Alphaproteobacteria bacterium]